MCSLRWRYACVCERVSVCVFSSTVESIAAYDTYRVSVTAAAAASFPRRRAVQNRCSLLYSERR
jgi:hypothetical protein